MITSIGDNAIADVFNAKKQYIKQIFFDFIIDADSINTNVQTLKTSLSLTLKNSINPHLEFTPGLGLEVKLKGSFVKEIITVNELELETSVEKSNEWLLQFE